MAYDVQKTDAQWREELTPEEYAVLRQAGTERAFTGEYTDTETKGVYRCKACQAKLFESDTKFHSGCGWGFPPPLRPAWKGGELGDPLGPPGTEATNHVRGGADAEPLQRVGGER